jgi:hypothetical protein
MERKREIERENKRLLSKIQKKAASSKGSDYSRSKQDKDYAVALARMEMITMYPRQRVMGQGRKTVEVGEHQIVLEGEDETGDEFELDPLYLRKPYTASDHEDYADYSNQYDDGDLGQQDLKHESSSFTTAEQYDSDLSNDSSKFSSIFSEAESGIFTFLTVIFRSFKPLLLGRV